MKQYIAILAIVVFLVSCQKAYKENNRSISVSVIIDITDLQQLHPESESIIPMFGLQYDVEKSVIFRITPLTDRQLNPVREIRLKDAGSNNKDNVGDDDNFRKKQIIHFYDTVRKSISEETQSALADTSLSYSECFTTILNEVLKRKKNAGDSVIILVFSDLNENSSVFNVYTNENKALLLQHPENVARIFEQKKSIPDSIKHTTLILVYDPKSREDDGVFMKMAEVYRLIFEHRGVTVMVQATNKSYYL